MSSAANFESAPVVGDEWPHSSLVWGVRAGRGDRVEAHSPLDGSVVQRARLLDRAEMETLLQSAPLPAISAAELQAFAQRLHAALRARSALFLEAIELETGFVRADCEEVFEGVLLYARDFSGVAPTENRAPVEYEVIGQKRRIRQLRVPWGLIAVVLPQSATLMLGVTCLLSALAAGNRVILRAPTQSARSMALLADAIAEAKAPDDSVSAVLARAKEFLQDVYASTSPTFVHYLGSSRHAASLMADAFEHAEPTLIDGEGNTWVWVGEDADPRAAAAILTQGALRFNGQTCTSINGALIHPAVFDAVSQQLGVLWKDLTAGDPRTANVDVGPLLDVAQAQWCERRIRESGGEIVCGGPRRENFLAPVLVKNPRPESDLVTQGLFGPALWIRSATAPEFVAQWPGNRFGLCAGVLSPSADAAWWLARLGNLARLEMNGDPSIEAVFEPWGGYPASGSNPVSVWMEKYTRVVAIDEPAL